MNGTSGFPFVKHLKKFISDIGAVAERYIFRGMIIAVNKMNYYHCPTDAYRKECNGVKTIEVEDKEFRFANKNLWRCAWAEHFDLDLDLEIPDVVNEQVILDTIDKYGMRGGEMGCCVKYCLPKHLRSDGGEHTSSSMRKKHSVAGRYFYI